MNTGDRVEIYKGRKNAPGTQGELFWMRRKSYGFYRSGVNPLREVTRVGVRLDDGTVAWDYLSNCRAVEKVSETV
jgi:hypothetical protein